MVEVGGEGEVSAWQEFCMQLPFAVLCGEKRLVLPQLSTS